MNKLFSLLLLTAVAVTASAQKKSAPAKEKPGVVHSTGTTKGKSYKVVHEPDTLVEITTDYGTMTVMLYKQTPMHRRNFLRLVSEGFYDSLMFHRVIKDFMIQGGDPASRNAGPEAFLGSGDVGYRIPAEFNKNLFHKKGALAAARDGNPEKASSGCQFYIVQGKKFTTQELSNVLNGINYQNKMMMLQEYTSRDSVKKAMEDFNMRGDQAGMEKYMNNIKLKIDKDFEPKMYMPNMNQIASYIEVGGTPHLDQSYTVFGEVVSGMEVIDKIAAEPTNSANRPTKDIRMKMKLVIR